MKQEYQNKTKIQYQNIQKRTKQQEEQYIKLKEIHKIHKNTHKYTKYQDKQMNRQTNRQGTRKSRTDQTDSGEKHTHTHTHTHTDAGVYV